LQKKILLNEEVIAINQDDTPAGRLLKDGEWMIYGRNLTDGSMAIAFYNPSEVVAKVSLVTRRILHIFVGQPEHSKLKPQTQHWDCKSISGKRPFSSCN
jgi:hypothetical protein